MRLAYAVSFEDFKSLQPPFTVRSGDNAGFKGALVACLLIALLGVFCMVEGFGWQVATFLIALGAVAAVGAYFWDKQSVRKAQQRHDENLAGGYQRVHCPNERVFEVNDDGFTASCKCGTMSRPWSELTQFSENEKYIALNTKSGGQVLPKSAFPNQAAITEFRVLVTEKVNQGRPTTARHVDFKCTKEDFRQARRLHVLHGGGWRPLLRVFATYACIMYGCFVIWNATHKPAVLCGVLGGAVAVPLLRLAGKRRKPVLVQLRIYFDEQGLYLQDPVTQSRVSWVQFAGYVEGSNMLLLYSHPRLYRIIPKRALTGQGTEFARMIKAKLAPYDYRKPLLKPQGQVPSPVRQPS